MSKRMNKGDEKECIFGKQELHVEQNLTSGAKRGKRQETREHRGDKGNRKLEQ